MRLYQPLLVLRLGLPLVGIVWLVISVYKMLKENKTITDLMMPVYVSCTSVMVGEILGRFLFYAIHVRIGV
jgi:DMSO reductase anchor subunit